MPGAVDRLCSHTALFRDQPFEYSNFMTMDLFTTIFTVWFIPLPTGLVVSCWFTLAGRRHAPQSKESEAWAPKTFSDLSRFCGGLIAVILGGGVTSSLVHPTGGVRDGPFVVDWELHVGMYQRIMRAVHMWFIG
jgi:hypothetical protein